MEICPTCKRPHYGLPGLHRCPPAFRVWCPEMLDEEAEADTIYAHDHADAATQWMSRYDDEGYVCHRNGHMVVLVRGPEDSEPKKYRITGEMVPEYHARAEP